VVPWGQEASCSWETPCWREGAAVFRPGTAGVEAALFLGLLLGELEPASAYRSNAMWWGNRKNMDFFRTWKL
jgi:hypothetical protein